MKIRRFILRGLLILAISIIVFISFGKVKTTFYIGSPFAIKNFDITATIDNYIVFKDSINKSKPLYNMIEKKLRVGFHTLRVTSEKMNIDTTKSLFIIWNQHIVIGYFPKDEYGLEGFFSLRNQFYPFYLE